MNEQDYQDVGKAIAGAVLEGGKSKAWAMSLIGPLEFGQADLEAWLVRYKRERYQAIRWQKRKLENRRQKIDQLKSKAEQVLGRSRTTDA